MGYGWKTFGKIPSDPWQYMSWLYFIFCCTTGTYLLDPWERKLFNAVFVVFVGLLSYASYIFLPMQVRDAVHYFAHS